MADRNPNIPHERRMDMEDRERFNEEEANRRFAEKQAKLDKETIPKMEDSKPVLPSVPADAAK